MTKSELILLTDWAEKYADFIWAFDVRPAPVTIEVIKARNDDYPFGIFDTHLGLNNDN